MKRFRYLKLSHPLCAVDCETTGVAPQRDRIVEVAVIKFTPDDRAVRFVRRINPGVPIPASSTAVHGLTDRDVAGCPKFSEIAPRLVRFLEDADLVGYNIARFDLPLLIAECRRAGIELPLQGRNIIDVQRIYHQREPRDLGAAVRHYVGADHESAHDAIGDARATAAVLDRMLAWYSDLPRSVDGLHDLLSDTDLGGRLRREEGRLLLAFGKHAGRSLDDVARHDPGYLEWLLSQEFFPDFKQLVSQALGEVSD